MIGSKRVIHAEGDVWSENDRTWTIKNGLKQSVSDKDQIRSSLVMPLTCPKCSQPMNGHLDEKMWDFHKQCFDCQIKFETELVRTGKFQEYQQIFINKNVVSILKEVKDEMKDFIERDNEDQIVTEEGQIESWIEDTEISKKEVSKQIVHADRLIEEYGTNKK